MAGNLLLVCEAQADVDAVTCEGAVLSGGPAVQGIPMVFTIRCADLSGKPLARQSFTVALNGGESSATAVHDAGDGTYRCSLTTLAHGTALLSVLNAGRAVAQSPYRVTVTQVRSHLFPFLRVVIAPTCALLMQHRVCDSK